MVVRNANNILAIDPSIRETGYVVFQRESTDHEFEPVEGSCLKTQKSDKYDKKGQDRLRRIGQINHGLQLVIKRRNIEYIVSELPTGSQSASAATTLGLVTGAVKTICDLNDISHSFYNDKMCKSVVFNKKMDKDEVVEAMQEEYPDAYIWQDVKYRDQSMADSIVVFKTALKEGDIE
jgi:Holliday junction resolvasome RuvABC endonuclease subunit